MAITHLLDTSVYSQPLNPAPHPGVVARWQALGDARLAISVITEAEVRYGLMLKGSAKWVRLFFYDVPDLGFPASRQVR
jgi:predicted nucleic acid-binding protein